MSKQHILKIHKAPLEALLSGAKTCEVRFNDRGFEVGDTVALREVNPFNDVWTGRPYLIRTISHIQTGYGLPEGLCVLSYAQPAAGEPIQVETVAITREDEDGLYLDWVLEGGISALEAPGVVLLVAHGEVTDRHGSGEVYLAPPAAAPVADGEPVAYEFIHRHIPGAEWERCSKDRFELYQAYHRQHGGEPPVRALYTTLPAAAHGDEAVRIDARLLELYQPPFRFDERGGYIWDAQNNMVADNHVEGDQAMRVRGWGRLSYRQDGEEVQDLMGQAMADALTARWEAAMRAQAGEGESS